MDMNTSLFRDASRVLSRVRVPRATFCTLILVLIYLASFVATPARGDDTDMWCGAAWSCDQVMPQPNVPARPYVPQMWTAIAISKSTLGNSTAWNAPSESIAEKLALEGVQQENHPPRLQHCDIWRQRLHRARRQPELGLGSRAGPTRG